MSRLVAFAFVVLALLVGVYGAGSGVALSSSAGPGPYNPDYRTAVAVYRHSSACAQHQIYSCQCTCAGGTFVASFDTSFSCLTSDCVGRYPACQSTSSVVPVGQYSYYDYGRGRSGDCIFISTQSGGLTTSSIRVNCASPTKGSSWTAQYYATNQACSGGYQSFGNAGMMCNQVVGGTGFSAESFTVDCSPATIAAQVQHGALALLVVALAAAKRLF